jgi:putative DNA primase/helicase
MGSEEEKEKIKNHIEELKRLSKQEKIMVKQERIMESLDNRRFIEAVLSRVENIGIQDKATSSKGVLNKKALHILVIEHLFKILKSMGLSLCRDNGTILAYNSTHWKHLPEQELKYLLRFTAEKSGTNHYIASHHSFVSSLLKQFDLISLPPRPEERKKTMINLRNGTLVITKDGVLLKEFDANDYIKYQLDFDYRPQADAPLFNKYLNETLPNPEVQANLSEFIGSIFIPAKVLKAEKILMLLGGGSNGKSVVHDIVTSLLGSHNVSAYSLANLTDDQGYQRAMLNNVLLNYSSEFSGIKNHGLFKQLVSQERIEARQPYGQAFIMEEYARLMVNLNELPKDFEMNIAFFRRLLIIEFKKTIGEDQQDKQLAQKIINSELSGVLNWALDGLKRFLVSGHFTPCAEMEAVVTNYRFQSDNVRQFVDECDYEPCTKEHIVAKDLYSYYREYCMASGFKPLNKINFLKRMENNGFVVERKSVGRVVFIKSIKSNIKKENEINLFDTRVEIDLPSPTINHES